MLARGPLVVALLCFTAPAGMRPLAAQNAAAASWQTTPASMLKTTLRSVAGAQERYRAAHGRYAATFELLRVSVQPELRVEILGAGAAGWQGKATHRMQPGRSCVMFVGSLEGAQPPSTDADHAMAGEEGIPLCDWMR
jgi:hypothetical protein